MNAALTPSTITAAELGAKLAAGERIDLIDVRTPAEFTEIHAQPARLFPLDRINPDEVRKSLGDNGEAPIYIICKSGNRGRQACEKLKAAGLNVVNVEGGTTAWAAAGLPVIRGRKSISLERQVRICAGAIVFAGTLLGVQVHPFFLVIPAFVGVGLFIAGLTDNCGMAMVLGKMPWNQRGAEVRTTN